MTDEEKERAIVEAFAQWLDYGRRGQGLTDNASFFYGVEREPGETDESLLARCRAKIAEYAPPQSSTAKGD